MKREVDVFTGVAFAALVSYGMMRYHLPAGTRILIVSVILIFWGGGGVLLFRRIFLKMTACVILLAGLFLFIKSAPALFF